MNKLLQEEFYHYGCDKILKELWLYPQMDQIYTNYIKPYGGLWTSHQNKYSLSDWLSYKEDSDNLDEIDSLYYLDSCLVKFKEKSKLLSIENENDYKNLKDSGFVKILDNPILINMYYYTKYIYEIIDYEKICEYYEILYINNMTHNNLSNFSVRTMYALSPNSIDYYKPIKVDYNEHKILEIKEKKYISEPDDNYYKLIQYVKTLFNENNESNYDLYIKKLYNEMNDIIKYLKNNIDFFEYKEINKLNLIETVVRNIYREKYMLKQKVLHK